VSAQAHQRVTAARRRVTPVPQRGFGRRVGTAKTRALAVARSAPRPGDREAVFTALRGVCDTAVVGQEILLLLIGAAVGVAVKTLVDPLLEKRKRRHARHEQWSEEGVKHADAVLEHLAKARSDGIARGGLLDPDALALSMLRSLDERWGPGKLVNAAGHDTAADELLPLANKAVDAWRTVKVAIMDDQHGADPHSEEYEPVFAVQAYEFAVRNFAAAARRSL
jgi:hypothetical protein